MKISAIVAVSLNGVIGRNGGIPWRETPEDRNLFRPDMERFKNLRMGHPVIMGRRTWESIPDKFRPLQGSTNIVMTRQFGNGVAGCRVVHSWSEALDVAEKSPGSDEVFVIGGQEVYKLAMPALNTVYLTLINKEYEGDAFFRLNSGEWKAPVEIVHDPSRKFSFLTFMR